MAQWRKVVVSGSNAILNQLEVTSGITGSLLGTSSYASFALSASYAPGISGGTASIALTASSVTTLNQNVIITGSLSIKDSASDFKVVGNGFSETYLQSNGNLVLQAGGNGVQVKSNNFNVEGYISASAAVTASGFKGDGSGLTGIVSATASYAHTASYVKVAESASYAETASVAILANTANTASYVLGSNVSGKVATAGTADTASYFAGTAVSASFASNAATADSATSAATASYVVTALTASYVANAEAAKTAATASYVAAAGVDGKVATAGTADTASYVAGNNVVGAVANATNAATASYLNTITAPVIFQSNLSVQGNLTVDGTASFSNTQNLNVADQFILLNSGSNQLQDSGIIIASGSNQGTAFYLEVANTGGKGRFAVAANVASDATSVTADAYAVTAQTASGSAPAAPTFGGTLAGFGNIHIDSETGDIYIYA